MSQPKKILAFVHFYDNETSVSTIYKDIISRFIEQCKTDAREFERPVVVSIEPSLFSAMQTRATLRAWEKEK